MSIIADSHLASAECYIWMVEDNSYSLGRIDVSLILVEWYPPFILKAQELIGKNCHSGPKEPQVDINGNRDESPSQE
ncbi:hypothetical protein TNCV_1873861 [Trichonephila clavipes]|nr:hypothetical protein TNCV_1873861 [Trichonephila clavipes]